jgi:hypothetical protein
MGTVEWGESSAVCILKPKPATSAPGPACRACVLQRGVQRADARARGNLHHGLVDLPAAVPPAAGQDGAAHSGLCFPFGIYGPAAPSRRGYWVISHCARFCPSPPRVFACGVCLEPRERCEVRALRSACLAIRAERVAAAHARVREPCRAGPHGRGQAVGCSGRGQARLGLARLSGLKRAEKEAGMAARGLAARPRSAAQGKGGR